MGLPDVATQDLARLIDDLKVKFSLSEGKHASNAAEVRAKTSCIKSSVFSDNSWTVCNMYTGMILSIGQHPARSLEISWLILYSDVKMQNILLTAKGTLKLGKSLPILTFWLYP